MKWNDEVNQRKMPWKGEKDPYRIWLSEVILQQTRVEQGRSYYEKFISQYPSVKHLAKAKDEEVFKLWEGLGYYSRCKNLLLTAKKIACNHNGVFPNTYDGILKLKGVGQYIASAIASFAFDLPYAVVDGNVFRLLSRIYGIETPVDSAEGKKEFTGLAQKLLDKTKPGRYNQAIMDFGATVCKPAPACSICPMKKICLAYRKGLVNHLPVKGKLKQKKQRWLYYFLFQIDKTVLVQKRTGKDIWQNLFEFYCLETYSEINWDEMVLQDWLLHQFEIKSFEWINISPVYTQQLTHQKIKGQFIRLKLQAVPKRLKHYALVDYRQLKKLAFPKFINQYLEDRPPGFF